MTEKTKTIYCHCAYYQFIPDTVKEKVLRALTASGIDFEPVTDLCGLCADRDPKLQTWAKNKSLRIIVCYPRAVKWLFHAAGAPLPAEGVDFLNMRRDSAEKIVASLPSASPGETKPNIRVETNGEWIPWFPVIDYDRCVNCKQCLNFCLFGTYELSANDTVEVRNPANCKTNCPACARACPHSAIIFPKYNDSPINGDEVCEEKSQDGQSKLDRAALCKLNVYDAIKERSTDKKRFSKNRGHTQDKPSILEQLDIPSDVLASLSPTEMANLTAKAKKPTGNETP